MGIKHISIGTIGRIKVKAIVTSNIRGKLSSGKYTGYAQTKKSESLEDLIDRGLLDCVFQHFRKIGVSNNSNRFHNSGEELSSFDYSTKLLNYEMEYSKLASVKRVAKRLKGRRVKRNNKYYIETIDEDNNIISVEKWEKGSVKKINSKKSKTYLMEIRDKQTKELLKIEKPTYAKDY